MFNEARFSNKKKVVIDHSPFVYMADNITTETGNVSIGTWEQVLDLSGEAEISKNPHYAMMLDRLVRVDGVSKNRYFNYLGVESGIGLEFPAAAPVISAATGGSLEAGVYSVFVVYVKNSGTADEVRSLPSPAATVTIGSPNNAISVTLVPSLNPEVDGIRIYRTLKDASGMAFKADEKPNSEATITLIQEDVYIRGNEEMSYDWVMPPVSDFVVSAGNRLFLFSQKYGRAFVSESGKLEQFGAYGYTSDFDRKDGDEITGVHATKNNILVFKRTKIFSVDLFSGFPVNRIDAQDGCINYRTISSDEVSGAVFFLSPSGVKAILPDGSKKDLTVNKVWKKDMLQHIVDLQDPANCFGCYSQASGCYHLYFQNPGAPELSVHYVCSLRESGQPTGAWSKYDHRYSSDPDNAGLKFYSFSILTDNAGLPYLCAPANDLESSNPVRMFQIDGQGEDTWFSETTFRYEPEESGVYYPDRILSSFCSGNASGLTRAEMEALPYFVFGSANSGVYPSGVPAASRFPTENFWYDVRRERADDSINFITGPLSPEESDALFAVSKVFPENAVISCEISRDWFLNQLISLLYGASFMGAIAPVRRLWPGGYGTGKPNSFVYTVDPAKNFENYYADNGDVSITGAYFLKEILYSDGTPVHVDHDGGFYADSSYFYFDAMVLDVEVLYYYLKTNGIEYDLLDEELGTIDWSSGVSIPDREGTDSIAVSVLLPLFRVDRSTGEISLVSSIPSGAVKFERKVPVIDTNGVYRPSLSGDLTRWFYRYSDGFVPVFHESTPEAAVVASLVDLGAFPVSSDRLLSIVEIQGAEPA